MEYTEYGFWEGIIMLIPSILLITGLYLFKVFSNKKYIKGFTLVYFIIIMCIALDTVMWVYSIQTNVIDYLVTMPNGNVEQHTIFGTALPIFIIYLIFMGKGKGKVTEENKSKESE